VIEVESRVLHLLGVTRHPAEARVTQVVSSFTADLEDAGRQIRFLVRDRTPSSPDAFGAVSRSRRRDDEKAREIAQSESCAELFVRTAGSECLGFGLILTLVSPLLSRGHRPERWRFSR